MGRFRVPTSPRSSEHSQQTQTLEYYERNAKRYTQETFYADLSSLYEVFTRRVPKGGRILDAGSGSGRDTLAFGRQGYVVSAFDASPALCERSTRRTGITTQLLRFQELEDEEEYDGIWACASLLHVPKMELPDAISRLVRALRPGGVLYMSFKHGFGERVTEDGRLFIDMTEDQLRRLIRDLPGTKLDELWITTGEGQFQGRGEWLNALLSKRWRRERGIQEEPARAQ